MAERGLSTELADHIMILVNRAVEQKLVPGEGDELRAAVEALVHDRREPVSHEELARVLVECVPGQVSRMTRWTSEVMAHRLLKRMVCTKLPYPTWSKNSVKP